VCNAGVCQPLFTGSGLEWATTFGGTLQGDPWTITNNNTRIRYTVEKDAYCFPSGGNPNEQTGTATATITVGSRATLFTFTLSGMGELYDNTYDRMTLTFDGQVVGRANSAGGGISCQDGPVVFQLTNPGAWPVRLESGTTHTFRLEFTTVCRGVHTDVLACPAGRAPAQWGARAWAKHEGCGQGSQAARQAGRLAGWLYRFAVQLS